MLVRAPSTHNLIIPASLEGRPSHSRAMVLSNRFPSHDPTAASALLLSRCGSHLCREVVLFFSRRPVSRSAHRAPYLSAVRRMHRLSASVVTLT